MDDDRYERAEEEDAWEFKIDGLRDEIKQLEEKLAKAREALKPFGVRVADLVFTEEDVNHAAAVYKELGGDD